MKINLSQTLWIVTDIRHCAKLFFDLFNCVEIRTFTFMGVSSDFGILLVSFLS